MHRALLRSDDQVWEPTRACPARSEVTGSYTPWVMRSLLTPLLPDPEVPAACRSTEQEPST